MSFNTTHGMGFLRKCFACFQRACHTRHRKKPRHGSRYLLDRSRVFEFNAWDDVQWDEEQEEQARQQVKQNSIIKLTEDQIKNYNSEAPKHWDTFYGVHSNRFFKDRHWLFTEFPELNFNGTEPCTALEVGCGVGNTVFPLLQFANNPNLFVYGCDFSSTAVQILKETPEYDADRCRAFVLDVASENWTGDQVPFEENGLDVVILIFVLSAIRPERFRNVVENLYRFVKPGGLVLFRDYGRYDLAQLRFKPGRCLGDNLYARGDGTMVYFFTQDEVRQLFTEVGFVEEDNRVDRRLQVNRGRMLKMYRVWIQAKYKKPH